MDQDLDLKLDELVGGLKQLNFVDIEGNRVEDFDGATIKKMTDYNSRNNTRNLFDLRIQVRTRTPEEALRGLGLQNKMKCVLVYKDDPVSEPHCVFVKDLVEVCGNLRFLCINSWGPKQDFLLQKIENTLYEVNITFEESKSTRMSSSSSTSSAPFHYSGPLTYFSVLNPPTHDRPNIDSGSNSPIWTPSFNSSYCSSPSFTNTNGWISMGRDSMDLETGEQDPADVPDDLLWDLTSQRGSDYPTFSGIYI